MAEFRMHDHKPQCTEDEKSAIRREFSLRRRRQWTLAIIVAPFIVVALLYAGTTADRLLGDRPLLSPTPAWFPWFAAVFAVLVVGGLVYSLRNWRCPRCSAYLGRAINPKHCPRCGVALRG